MSRHALSRPRWYAAAGVRALKTAAQTVLALIGTSAVGVTDVDWVGVASAAGLAAVLSVLTSLGGLPEVTDTTGADSGLGVLTPEEAALVRDWRAVEGTVASSVDPD